MDNYTIIMAIMGILTFGLLVLSCKGFKSQKLRITISQLDADNKLTVIEVTRKYGDAWNDFKDFKCYHQGNTKIWLANHWVHKIEEIR